MPTYVYDHVHLYFMWMTTSESMGIRECLDLGLFYNMEIDRRTFELLWNPHSCVFVLEILLTALWEHYWRCPFNRPTIANQIISHKEINLNDILN